MRLLIGAAGTGGSAYPALAVLPALPADTEILWVGAQGGMEAPLVQRAGIRYTAIPAAGVHGVGLRRLPGNIALILRGITSARRILAEFKPDAILFTGGFIAFPLAVAARGIPSLLYVPDIEPGLALKTISRMADTIALTAQESKRYFPIKKNMVVTGYPVRPEISSWQRDSARQNFNLPRSAQVLLVFGGSKGARSINSALVNNLESILDLAHVIHISGELDWQTVSTARARLAPERSTRYQAFPYLHEDMGAALASADLVVCRAGASSLGEFPAHGLPAVLVPYPYAWRYQTVNASYLVDQGAAVILEDEDLQARLVSSIQGLLTDTTRLSAMRSAMRKLSQPQAATNIAQQLLLLAGEGR